jgi:hypothetical protein
MLVPTWRTFGIEIDTPPDQKDLADALERGLAGTTNGVRPKVFPVAGVNSVRPLLAIRACSLTCPWYSYHHTGSWGTLSMLSQWEISLGRRKRHRPYRGLREAGLPGAFLGLIGLTVIIIAFTVIFYSAEAVLAVGTQP